MKTTEIQTLLQQAGAVRSACDLDLLAFLWRHPRALLTSERLAQVLGYRLLDVGVALDHLFELGLLERSKNPAPHVARLYLLLLDGPRGEATRRLIVLASDAEDRRAVLRALKSGAEELDEGAERQRRSLRGVGGGRSGGRASD